ncbi:MAG: hypothetical protein GY771_13195 [bacterium]|nr:hypothetical protein [bacterium]
MSDISPLPSLSNMPMIDKVCDILGPATAMILLREIGQDLGGTKADLETLQGPYEEVREGVFIQRKCPFADALNQFKDDCGDLPKAIGELADFANSHGCAWVSAFCGIHQNIRATKDSNTNQVACKAGNGSIHYVENEFVSEEEAIEILKDAVCIYAIAN